MKERQWFKRYAQDLLSTTMTREEYGLYSSLLLACQEERRNTSRKSLEVKKSKQCRSGSTARSRGPR